MDAITADEVAYLAISVLALLGFCLWLWKS
jgi:hypothetical protein